MSLIHWWPLNGNTKDYGTKPVALLNNGATVDNNGKIGKCYNFTNSQYMQGNNLEFTSLTNSSVCFWIKIASNEGDWLPFTGQSTSHYMLATQGGTGTFYHSYVGINTLKIYCDGTLRNSPINDGNWHHYCITGVDLSTWTTFFVNCYGGDNDPYGWNFNGKINDIRIYDHALSAKEVKEISKGLVLHYDFNDPYVEGTTNIDPLRDPGTSPDFGHMTTCERVTFKGKDCWHVIVNASSSGWIGSYSSLTGLSAGEVGTRSCWLYVPSQQQIGWHGVPFAFENMDWSYSYPGHNYDTSKMDTWQYCYSTAKASSTSSNYLFYFCATSNSSIHIEFYIANIQFEVKDHATPYVNGTRPAGLVYDNSGYGYNGTPVGNLQLVSGSPSGLHSAKFESNTYVDIPTLPEFPTVSYSFWIKIDNADSAYRSIFNVKNSPTGGLWLSLNTESYGLWSYYSSSPSYSGAGDYIAANTWIHCVFVFNNGVGNWYKNGQYLGNNVSYPNLPKIPSNHYCLGDSYTGSSWGGTPFNGQIADFKIFSTALSASDILAEYQRKASVDKNGNLFTGELVETNTNTVINAQVATAKKSSLGWVQGAISKSTYNTYYPDSNGSGLSLYTQSNLSVTGTDSGYRIYSAPNLTVSGNGTTMWGGLCVAPMLVSNCIVKGHRYRLSWHMEGKSSRAFGDWGWSDQVGWGCGTVRPSPSDVVSKVPGTNWQGSMDCYYEFTVNDDLFKTCTNNGGNSAYTVGTDYLSYAGFKIGYNYTDTGSLGTDVYITDICFIDVTDNKTYKITKNGLVKTTQLISGQRNSARIHNSGMVNVTDIKEL